MDWAFAVTGSVDGDDGLALSVGGGGDVVVLTTGPQLASPSNSIAANAAESPPRLMPRA